MQQNSETGMLWLAKYIDYLASCWWQFERNWAICLEFDPVSYNKGLFGAFMLPLYLEHTVFEQNKILMKWC